MLGLITLSLVACGDPAEMPDAAMGDGAMPLDAGADASVVVCERDQDCDDGLFCNGEERCDPSTGGDGCVAGESICMEGCDEDADTCTACAPEDTDVDGDGDPSRACGGNDCDDLDPTRASTLFEVCDLLGVDEDCDLSTLYNARASGAPGDRDGDGHVDMACANIVGDEEAIGDDCDDRDPAIFTGAEERCNGVDDDCDGAVDETFDCVQSTTVVGTNTCGNEGERRCSETCEWLDDAFYVAESIATCDYCDDSGMGVGQELGFTTDRSYDLCSDTESFGEVNRVPGVAVCFPRTLGPDPSSPRVGGLFLPALSLGHGGLRATFMIGPDDHDGALTDVQPTPNPRSWSWVLLRGADASVGSLGDAGIPDGDGLAFQMWYDDGWQVRLLGLAGSTVTEIARSGTSVVELDVSMDVRPDDPSTAVDETRVTFTVPCSGGAACSFSGNRIYTECANDPALGTDPVVAEAEPCGVTLTPGDVFRFGMVASLDAGRAGVDADHFVQHLSVCR